MSRWLIRIAGGLVAVTLIFALLFWHLCNVACESYAATARPGTVLDDCVTVSVWFYLFLMVVMISIAILSMGIAIGAYFWSRNRAAQTVSFIADDR